MKKIKVEIWSDIVCPWCYIGKRRFEEALKNFKNASDVEVEYKSFQLNPDTVTDPHSSTVEYLSNKYGIDRQRAAAMTANVTQIAKEIGLSYDLENAIVANTFRAHQLLHLAKIHSRQLILKENLMRAYFTDRKNVDDVNVLVDIATASGLSADESREVLEKKSFEEAVRLDIYEAQQLGITGVPFFVLDRKYGISGAQPTEHFLQALKQCLIAPQQV